jgi:hypothetical protein
MLILILVVAELEGQLKEKDAAVTAVLAAATGGSSVHALNNHHHHQIQQQQHHHHQIPQFHPLARSATTAQLSPLARLSISDPFDPTGVNVSPSNHGYPTPFSASSGHNIADLLQQQQQQQSPFNLQLPHFETNGLQAPQSEVNTSPTTPGEVPTTTANGYSSLLWSNWPERLPNPTLLAHLVETFFSCHPHAVRLLHRPTFVASLQLPPSHADFPALSLLHAICALASLWSPLVAGDEVHINIPDKDEKEGGDARSKRDWFGEMHARWSREEEERNATEGTGVFQGLQCTSKPSHFILYSYLCSHCGVDVVLLCTCEMGRGLAVHLQGTPLRRPHGPQHHTHTRTTLTQLDDAQYPRSTKGRDRSRNEAYDFLARLLLRISTFHSKLRALY